MNSSLVGGFNIGINKYISDEKINATIEFIKYLTSEEVQKEIIIKKLHLYSGLNYLYDDTEVCSVVNCELVKNIQLFKLPDEIENNEEYMNEAVEYINEFLNDRISAKELLSDIEDIYKIYQFNIYSGTAIIMLIVLIFIFLVCFFSIFLLFIPKLKVYFRFLSLDLWIIYSIGSLLMVGANFSFFGKLTETKCLFRHIDMSIGTVMIFSVLIYRLILNFPKLNKFSMWVGNNKYLFINIIIMTQVILSVMIVLLRGISTTNVYLKGYKNFCVCKNGVNSSGYIIYTCQIMLNKIYYALICILIFFEWNITETFSEIRNLSIIIIMNGISQFLIWIIFNLSINHYRIYYIISINISLLFPFMNQIYMFIIRILLRKYFTTEDEDKKIVDNLLFLNNYSTTKDSNTFASHEERKSISSKSTNSNKFNKSKILNYHYATSQI